METLQQLAMRHGAGKGTHSYMPTYEKLLRHLCDEEIAVAEVGIDNGGCLNMWASFFPKAFVVGVDNNLANIRYKLHERVRVRECSQIDPAIESLFRTESLDIIIDDADHGVENQKTCARYLWSRLKPGGWYFVEDIQDIRACLDWAREYRHFRMFTWDFHRHFDREWQPDDILLCVRKEPVEANWWEGIA